MSNVTALRRPIKFEQVMMDDPAVERMEDASTTSAYAKARVGGKLVIVRVMARLHDDDAVDAVMTAILKTSEK